MLIEIIKDYYEKRQLKWPSFDSAMKFVHTELAEVYELDLSREGGWVRNNPQNKPSFNKDDLAKELGDAVMMLYVAGIVEGIDVEQALKNKLAEKLKKLSLPPYRKERMSKKINLDKERQILEQLELNL